MKVGVVGGGPGGASAALVMARAGADVTLFAAPLRGEKPCGGALPEFLLPRIDGFDASALDAVIAPRAVLENGRGSSLELVLDGVRIFRRGDFDPALQRAAERAGARVVAARADSIRLGAQGAVVRCGGEERRFDWLIGADGARGLSRRTLGLEAAGESVGLGASLRGVAGSSLVLSFPGDGDAYAWIFPRPGGVSVGIAFSPHTLRDAGARRQLEELLDRHLAAGWGSAPGPRYRYPIPVFGPWTAQAVARGLASRVLLVGDAAAVADPLTREGIRYAVLSGMWAAEALAAGRPEDYLERLGASWEGEMERATRARRLFFEGPVGQWMVPVARHHAGVRGVLEDLLACRLEYGELRHRLLRAAFHPRPAAGTQATRDARQSTA